MHLESGNDEMHLTVTIVRHGQSVDNTKQLWAGHKDSPLTNRGMAQAKALAASLKSARPAIDKVYSSDLLRARWTAEQICHALSGTSSSPAASSQKKQNSSNDISRNAKDGEPTAKRIKKSHDGPQSTSLSAAWPIEHRVFREQFFGDSEGTTWLTVEKPSSAGGSFKGGESTQDVALRAKQVVDKVIKPWMLLTVMLKEPRHIVIVAHGIFISQLKQAIAALDASAMLTPSFSLPNTAYHRCTISHPTNDADQGADMDETSRKRLLSITVDGQSVPEAPFNYKGYTTLKPKVSHEGTYQEHLQAVKKMGTLGSVAWSPQQRSVADMFARPKASST